MMASKHKDIIEYVSDKGKMKEVTRNFLKENNAEKNKALLVFDKENKELKATIKTLIKRHREDVYSTL